MSLSKSFADDFCLTKKKDYFYNLKRIEDASTIFHGELVGSNPLAEDYWCEPPIGFFYNCEIMLVVYGSKASVILAVNKTAGGENYSVVIKNPNNFPKVLRNAGFEPNKPYPEMDVADIIRLIN